MIPNSSLSAIAAVPFTCWSRREMVPIFYLFLEQYAMVIHVRIIQARRCWMPFVHLTSTQPWHPRNLPRSHVALWPSLSYYGSSGPSGSGGAELSCEHWVQESTHGMRSKQGTEVRRQESGPLAGHSCVDLIDRLCPENCHYMSCHKANAIYCTGIFWWRKPQEAIIVLLRFT